MCNPAAYHFRAFYIEDLDSPSITYIHTPLLLKITTSCFFKLLPTQCATRQHNMLEYFIQKSDSAPCILQEALNRHNLLETGNIYSKRMLKNSAHFHFYLIAGGPIAAIVAFISVHILIWICNPKFPQTYHRNGIQGKETLSINCLS